MNFKNKKDRAYILRRLRHGIVELPSPYSHLKSPCWIAQHRVRADGTIENSYTTMRVNNNNLGRHLVALAWKLGSLPDPALIACHLCDCKACCNPDHIEAGTPAEDRRQACERGRIARGERHGSHTHPERVPRGEKNRMATITAATAAEIRWCLQNPDKWFSPDLQAQYHHLTALAIHFNVPIATVKGIANGAWSHVEPVRPAKLPSLSGTASSPEPPLPQRRTVLSDEQVKAIRIAYYQTDEPRHFVRDQARKYRVSTATIWNVLKQKTRKHLTPDILPVNESGHGMSKFSDRVIQEIRATFDAYWKTHTVDGIISTLARLFEVSKAHVRNICERAIRIDVADDDTAVVPFEKLPFKPLTLSGANHPLSKLDDNKVLEILQRIGAGESKTAIAREHKVSIGLIYSIHKGRTWRHVWLRFQEQEKSRSSGGEGGNQ